ncbi:hypothetical protein MUO32_06780 [Shinella sp. CPCC 101442]|uniref:calcium-binding protein n=1 Tax=Shinella sp. CPCC 101442 TaxID=2932265 RepID=UPI002152ED59|nr:calcium-binding protein [Shinella sp. CPCC 101442]MCR6498726.1 hypothetical protein [Shinella sp. CPCC 101442]
MTVFTISPGEFHADIPAGSYGEITVVANGKGANELWLLGDVRVSQLMLTPAAKSISLIMGNHHLRGTTGNDTFDLTGVGYCESAYAMELDGGNDLFRAGLGGVWVDGGSGNDVIYGGVSADRLLGGAGGDSIYGGGGYDKLSGGAGADVFVAALRRRGVDNDSQNTISDFAPGVDRIDISSYGVSSFRQLQFILESKSGGDTYFEAKFGEAWNSFTIKGVTKAKLSAGDFIFHTGSARDVLGTDFSDRLFAASGGSTLKGGLGNNDLFGGTGADVFVAPTRKEIANDGDTNTIFDFDLGTDRIDVSAYGISSFGQLQHILETRSKTDAYFEVTFRSFTSGFVLKGIAEDQLSARDFIFYAGSVKQVVGNYYNDQLFAGSRGSILKGLGGSDTLFGGAGNDRLDGGSGVDTLYGGKGDDVYVVDDFGDVTIEKAREGTDLVISYSSNIKLADNIENLVLRGDDEFSDGEGNDLANVITGNIKGNSLRGHGGNDTLNGGAGRDTLEGGAGNDTLNGGSGIDEMEGGDGDDVYIVDEKYDSIYEDWEAGIDLVKASFSYTLGWSAVENLILTGTGNIDGTGNDYANTIKGNSGNNLLKGNGGHDILFGGAGNDMLDGGSLDDGIGIDRMYGGTGDDSYLVGEAGDRVIERKGEGIDSVEAWISYTLPANVENLTLKNAGDADGTGNQLANIIVGGRRENVLKGMAGDDTLVGGRGADDLYGGTGKDTFVFTSAKDSTTFTSGRDTISDFSHKQGDRIDLSGIDARSSTARNDAFAFVGAKEFSKKAGELRFEKKVGETYIHGDVDGDGKADFSIKLDSALALVKGDFIL